MKNEEIQNFGNKNRLLGGIRSAALIQEVDNIGLRLGGSNKNRKTGNEDQHHFSCIQRARLIPMTAKLSLRLGLNIRHSALYTGMILQFIVGCGSKTEVKSKTEISVPKSDVVLSGGKPEAYLASNTTTQQKLELEYLSSNQVRFKFVSSSSNCSDTLFGLANEVTSIAGKRNISWEDGKTHWATTFIGQNGKCITEIKLSYDLAKISVSNCSPPEKPGCPAKSIEPMKRSEK